MSRALCRALFLDRDGVLIEDRGYMRDPALVYPLPGAPEALAALASEGWKLIVVSNQSGVGRGLISAAERDSVQSCFLETMRARGVPIAASYICSHAPETACECRKPSPYFLFQAAREHSIDLAASWMIGDRQADIVCGREAGCSTIWLRNAVFPSEQEQPTFIADDWIAIRRRLQDERPPCA